MPTKRASSTLVTGLALTMSASLLVGCASGSGSETDKSRTGNPVAGGTLA
ncbi:MAG: hypothetical protein JWP30_559, partial [Homoserinimonas sp.]|nr:hypothetical protein [Homoserinimonas sp.]